MEDEDEKEESVEEGIVPSHFLVGEWRMIV